MRPHLYKGGSALHIYLSAVPQEAQAASGHCPSLAHVAYRIGTGSALLRQNLPLRTRGGLLSVSDRNAAVVENPESLCAAVMRECNRWGYTGTLLDFEEAVRPDLLEFARLLAQKLRSARRTLYLPERYAPVQCAVPLICTAVSGGSLEQRLREAIGQHRGYGGQAALDVQRLRMDFLLPAPSGEGTPLSAEQFQHLMEQESPSVFFSQDLCARYFTYSRNGETHFVLFDDSETLRRKLRMGTALGYCAAFFMWPEIRDIAGELFP